MPIRSPEPDTINTHRGAPAHYCVAEDEACCHDRRFDPVEQAFELAHEIDVFFQCRGTCSSHSDKSQLRSRVTLGIALPDIPPRSRQLCF